MPEAVQACPLISNTANVFQQVPQNTFRDTHFIEWLPHNSTVHAFKVHHFSLNRVETIVSTVEPTLMSCVLYGKNSQRLLSNLTLIPKLVIPHTVKGFEVPTKTSSYACGTWQFVYIMLKTCGFCTFFNVAVVTHVTVRDLSVTRWQNSKIMRHLFYKSTSFARKSVPIHSKTSDCGLKAVTLPFSMASFERIMTFRQEVTRLSRDGKADS